MVLAQTKSKYIDTSQSNASNPMYLFVCLLFIYYSQGLHIMDLDLALQKSTHHVTLLILHSHNLR